MQFYAQLGGLKLINPPKESFQLTDVLDNIATFEFLIQNNSGNRAILSSLSDDLEIRRVSDDALLFSGKIDHGSIQYLSRHRINLSGHAAFIELGDTLFKRLADADASAAEIVNESFGSASGKYNIGQDETFLAIKIPYTVAGIQNGGTTVVIEYSKGSGVWATLDCLDESRAFTKVAGTYYLIIPNKPDDWAKDTVSAKTKYWVRFRISAGSYSTNPTFGTIYTGKSDILRIQFDNIAADTILGYVLDGTGYSEDAVDQCPADLISMRGEYESRLQWIAAIANTLTWTDGSDKKYYDWWVTTDKKVHFKQQRGSSKGDISADLVMLDNSQNYQGIANLIYALGSFDGINQRRAIVENQASQDSYSLREIPLKDLRFSHESSLKELIEKHLTNSKSPLREISCEVTTQFWLDSALEIGDTIVIDQPEWAVSAQTFRIQRASIGPSRTTLDLGVQQVHLENIRDVLQKQIDVSGVFMQGCTTAFSLPSFAQNIEKTAADNFYSYMQFKIPKNCKYVNSLDLFWYLDNFRAPSKITAGGSAHSHTITGQATAAGSAHTHSITGKATSGGAAHSHGFGAAESTQAQLADWAVGRLVYTYTEGYFTDNVHTHNINCPYDAACPTFQVEGRSRAGSQVNICCDWADVGGGGYLKTGAPSGSHFGKLPNELTSEHHFATKYHTHKLQGATTVDESTHTHPITGIATDSESAHTHTITGQATDSESAHTHAIGYGIQEEAAPANIIAVDIKIGAGGWNALPDSPYTGDKSEVDIRDVVGQNISGGEIIQIRFLPNTAGRCWIRGGGDFQGFIESK